MDQIEQLRRLLPHWIDHNGEHAHEFERYATRAEEIKDKLLAAARALADANARLSEALNLLGGPVEQDHE